jgi:hypothetical protein
MIENFLPLWLGGRDKLMNSLTDGLARPKRHRFEKLTVLQWGN